MKLQKYSLLMFDQEIAQKSNHDATITVHLNPMKEKR